MSSNLVITKMKFIMFFLKNWRPFNDPSTYLPFNENFLCIFCEKKTSFQKWYNWEQMHNTLPASLSLLFSPLFLLLFSLSLSTSFSLPLFLSLLSLTFSLFSSLPSFYYPRSSVSQDLDLAKKHNKKKNSAEIKNAIFKTVTIL